MAAPGTLNSPSPASVEWGGLGLIELKATLGIYRLNEFNADEDPDLIRSDDEPLPVRFDVSGHSGEQDLLHCRRLHTIGGVSTTAFPFLKAVGPRVVRRYFSKHVFFYRFYWHSYVKNTRIPRFPLIVHPKTIGDEHPDLIIALMMLMTGSLQFASMSRPLQM
ncbi:hypothetical protein AVEN_100017-1 [Araneus ventricosus]|uniref:Uncharacterized protein n=1 Tax=Araneus ventricosus TaxID=182803 RepID=A0A4Y2BJG2_ARAVE|nr:hypothetical protein AVEN_100017-1 [Araneus ventricosus]